VEALVAPGQASADAPVLPIAGLRYLVTGVLTDRSLAYHVAKLMQESGAEVLLTGFGRARRLTERTARTLPRPVDVLELDMVNPGDYERVAAEVGERWGALDGVLHAVAYAPPPVWTTPFLEVADEDLDVAMHTSVYSFKALAAATLPLLDQSGGGSILGLTSIPGRLTEHYAWMSVVKAALDALAKQMAIHLGPAGTRVNLIACGPIRTNAAGGVPGFGYTEAAYRERAPLGWDGRDHAAVASSACFLLSPAARHITGETLNVDGGMHAVL
jgi:meromycolic acid enoyl-[acyl-carrier-protein] reductase